jgi:hypothetical protein
MKVGQDVTELLANWKCDEQGNCHEGCAAVSELLTARMVANDTVKCRVMLHYVKLGNPCPIYRITQAVKSGLLWA